MKKIFLCLVWQLYCYLLRANLAQGYKTFFMLNSAEHEIYPVYVVGILTFIGMVNTTSERLQALTFFICRYFSFYQQLKFCAQLS